MRGLSLVAASGGHSSSRCVGLSLSRPLLLWSTNSRRAGSVVVAHGPSCSVACGIFLDQGSNPCPLHWQADSQPLRHQGSPHVIFFSVKKKNQTQAPNSHWAPWLPYLGSISGLPPPLLCSGSLRDIPLGETLGQTGRLTCLVSQPSG